MKIKRILTNGCIFYTVLITAFYTFGLLAEGASGWIPTLRIAYSLLGFSVGFSALNELLASVPLGFAPRVLLHLVSTALLYYLIFVLGGGFRQNGGTTLAAMLAFAVLYAVGLAIVLIARWLFGPKKTDSEYKSIFDK